MAIDCKAQPGGGDASGARVSGDGGGGGAAVRLDQGHISTAVAIGSF